MTHARQSRLAESAAGRALLHAGALLRDGRVLKHLQGILRDPGVLDAAETIGAIIGIAAFFYLVWVATPAGIFGE
jgi:hypothetical protein